mmetsp:Transcript_5951/g.36869  ORF Transcript_5951/g.36869 Transcript_5951/m.36869 type:complete len:139 (-) Transcript_5951:2340-2756(-)
MASAGGLRVVIKLPRRIQEEPRAPPYETEGTKQPSTKRKREVRGTKAWETTSEEKKNDPRHECGLPPQPKKRRRKSGKKTGTRCTLKEQPCETIRPEASVERPRVWFSPYVIRDASHPDETHEEEIFPHQQADGSSKA